MTDGQNVSLLPLKCFKSNEKNYLTLFGTSFSYLILTDIIVSQMLCVSPSKVWGLFEYILLAIKKSLKNVTDIPI
jgi:hypothetical protein